MTVTEQTGRKKTLLLLAAAMLCAALLTACGGKSSGQDGQVSSSSGQTGPAIGQAGVKDVLDAGVAKETAGSGSERDGESVREQTRETAQEQAAKDPQTAAAEEPAPADPVPEDTARSVDLDLTGLSDTMVYSEVYDMAADPDKYAGKSVRLSGRFAALTDQDTGNVIFTCLVLDGTACCIQGLDFEPSGSLQYPEDFPQQAEKITVTGVFDSHQVGGANYGVLRDAEFE